MAMSVFNGDILYIFYNENITQLPATLIHDNPMLASPISYK